MTTTIDKDQALVALKAAVATAPDFIYRDSYGFCSYVIPENPIGEDDDVRAEGKPFQCIVGQVFTVLGIPLEAQENLYGSAAAACKTLARAWDNDTSMNKLDELGVGIYEFSPEAIELLNTAQGWQDGYKVTWSEALALAEANIPSYGDYDSSNHLWRKAQDFLGREFDNAAGFSLDQSMAYA